MATALLAGATGVVGSQCLRILLGHPGWTAVLVVARRDTAGARAPRKLRQIVTDFSVLDSHRTELVADHVFCALGTTMRKAGSRAAFREVDFEYPMRLAQLTRANGARHFSLVSAVGADRRSAFYYSRVKGELEDELIGMKWPSLAIFRPSLIEGQRDEVRLIERSSARLLRCAPRAWRPVAAADIAGAMIAVALDSPAGVTIVESARISELAQRRGG